MELYNKPNQVEPVQVIFTHLLSGLYVRILYYSMFGTGLLRNLKEMNGKQRFFALKKAKNLLQIVYQAAKNGPDNYRCHYELLAAEWFRHTGQIDQAMIHYQKSLIWCQRSGLPYMLGFTHEFLGDLWLELGDHLIAKTHLTKARDYYMSWGAVTKAGAMDRAYPEWFTSSRPLNPVSKDDFPKSSALAPNQMLDVMSMIQVSQTLSTYAAPDELVKKILKITLENAGATEGFLALRVGETFRVKVNGDVGASTNLVAQDVPVQDYAKVSPRIFQFVAHSKRPLLLDDALHQGGFTTDPYVLAAGSRSLICMPVMHLGEVLAILWLENKHLAHAFTEERMELLNILAAQGAISLKNTEYLLKIPEKIRLENQLAAAQAVQKALLPTTPAPPEVSIALHHRAADLIGGDWLSYEVDEELSYLYLCIGDMSGSGIPSALLTAAAAGAVKAALSNISRQHRSLSMAARLKIIAQGVNKTVRDTGNPSGRSMTMIFVVLDLTTGQGSFLNAGHIPILHFKTNQISSLIVPGSLLGEHTDPNFDTKPFTMTPGDSLFLYTDGLMENLGVNDQPLHHLALRRLLQTAILKYQKEPTEVATELIDQLDQRRALNAPKDDCSFVIVKLKDYRLKSLKAQLYHRGRS